MDTEVKQFWKERKLEALSQEEWESLCDGCGKCCLLKLMDDKSKVVYYTNIVCRYFDLETCHCMDYEKRHELVPDCVFLTPKNVLEFSWLPESCAYRQVANGKDLAWWHPLISGDAKSVAMAGISIKGKVINEEDIDDVDLEDMVVNWFD